MLVIFKSSSSADITMFGDVAEKLLEMMGQSGQVPGAILAADVPAALSSLQAALEKMEPVESSTDAQDDDAPVGLGTRAVPLIKLLEASIAGKEDVIWES